MNKPCRLYGLGIGLALLSVHGQGRELVSAAADREAVAVTIYNDDLALIKERRKAELGTGTQRILLQDVAARIRPETALLRAATGPALRLIEQNFDFDLLTPQKLLEKYVGREVTVIRSHPTTDAERGEKATVLAAGQGTVLRFADRIETGVPGRLAFDSVPGTLRDRPTLSVLLEAGGGRQSLELSYLTAGFGWKADYVANLDADGKTLDLNGWVTLTNMSGASFDNAALQLVAGTLNRVKPNVSPARARIRTKAIVFDSTEAVEESLMDYHLYRFERPTSIADNQTKQLALLSASGVPVRREYMLVGNDYYYRDRYRQAGQKFKPVVYLDFENKPPLGKPLPAGVIRVYAPDRSGAVQFVGEDRVEHTARNERMKLRLGEAFDITAERTQTQYKRPTNNSAETSWQVELRNAKDEAVKVRVQEHLPGDWEMLQESHPHAREAARMAVWTIEVPANGRSVLEYTMRVTW